STGSNLREVIVGAALRGRPSIEARKHGRPRRAAPTKDPLMRFLLLVLCMLLPVPQAQQPTPPETVYVLKPAHVFDGESPQLHDDWVVLVRGERIEAAGPAAGINAPADAKVIDLPGMTLLPGLIEAHSHILLHPYSETSWNDQVAHESLSLRVARATNH